MAGSYIALHSETRGLKWTWRGRKVRRPDQCMGNPCKRLDFNCGELLECFKLET